MRERELLQWEFESNGPEAAADMPEEELHAIPAEQVPEAAPTLATAPVQPRLSDQVAQLARDLCLGPSYGAVAGEFPLLAPSSAGAARASPEEKVKAQARAKEKNKVPGWSSEEMKQRPNIAVVEDTEEMKGRRRLLQSEMDLRWKILAVRMEEEVLDKYKVEESKREAFKGRGNPLEWKEYAETRDIKFESGEKTAGQ